MKEISHQSLHEIRDIIPGQNYANIKARLDQLLPSEYSSVFSKVVIKGVAGAWYGDDHTKYILYSAANADEKEEIAIVLEQVKNFSIAELAKQMPYIEKVFCIPSQDQIFWYRNGNGAIGVTLAQWGFQKRSGGKDADIIDMLISAPRTKTQEDVTVQINFSDGNPAASTPFKLTIFNNVKDCTTKEDGSFYIGKIFGGQKFSIEDSEGGQLQTFEVIPEGTYTAVFNLYTSAVIKVTNQHGKPLPGFRLLIDDQKQTADDSASVRIENVLLSQGKNISVKLENGGCEEKFRLEREEEKNEFTYVVQEKEVPPVPPIVPQPPDLPDPPTPQKMINFHLEDYDGSPLKNMPFSVVGKGGQPIDCVTDENGIGQIPADQLEGKKKYKLKFTITPQQREVIDKNKTSQK